MAVKEIEGKAKAHKIGLIIAGIQLLLTIICLVFLFVLDLLNPLLVAGAGLVFLLIWLIVFLTQYTSRMHVRGKVISIIMCVVLGVSSYAIGQAEGMLGMITGSGYEIDQMAVVVLKDDPAETIEDVLEYDFGVQKRTTGIDGEKAVSAVEQLEAEFSKDISLYGYSSLDGVVQGLYDGGVRAIIINEALIHTVEEHFDGFSEKTKIIHRIELKTEMEQTAQGKKLEEPFNVYISGIDVYGDISTNSRSDVNIIATVNPKTGQVLLTTTPRDYYVPIPKVTNGQCDKLTHAGIYGITASMETLEELYGIEIDYYVRVNFSGLQNIVDAIGGISVYSEYTFKTYLEPHYQFYEGYNEMNGKEALWFARDRKSVPGGERQRGKNQQQVIKGLIDKITSPAILTNYSALMNAVGESVQMNFSEAQIKNLVKDQIKYGTKWNIKSLSADGRDAREYCYSYSGSSLYVMIPDYDTVDYISSVMNKVIAGETLTDADETGIDHIGENE